MTKPIYFAPLRVPFVDLETGLISHEWQLLLQAMFNRIGGTNGQSNDDILQGVPNELGAAELLALQSTATDAAGQSPPAIPQLSTNDLLSELYQSRDQVAELQKRIQDLQQGPICL